MAIAADHYINRELSWLAFNRRVLEEAENAEVPALERLKFLAITASNLEEFFMVRVGGLLLQRHAQAASTDPAGMTVTEQLDAIEREVRAMVERQYDCFCRHLEPLLEQHGIQRVSMDAATARHLDAARRVFQDQIFPVLSPMGLSAENDFPLLVGGTLHVLIQIRTEGEDPPYRFALMPLGVALPRIITLPTNQGFSFALLEDIVRFFIEDFFPGEQVLSVTPFRITRNADLSLQEDAAADLLHGMKELLQQRRTAGCVRLEVSSDAPTACLEFLQTRLGVGDQLTYTIPGPLDLSAFMQMSGLEGYDFLRYEPWPPVRSPIVDPSQPMFATIAERNVLLSHPYESYEPVVRLIEEAATDPDVLAIKQTLYRTSRDSRIVAALKRAAERGKYVTAIVELKARFDEARNIEWAQELEQAGVQVIYGVKNLKTHAKICIIVRREPRGIVRYLHFGTGNYNESTARLYSDISYMTCNEEYGRDASAFFNAITGYSQPQQYHTLEAAPIGLRKRLLSLIEGEIFRKKQGQKAAITAKLNALVDPQLIEALYRASQAGVPVRLNIRSICCLRPGVPDLSEHIEVVSIIDRFLEHARILHFHHGGDDLVFISSADWMPRNLDRRIELLVPIEDSASQKRILEMLDIYFSDNCQSWELQPDASYRRRQPAAHQPRIRAQERLYRLAADAIRQAELARQTVFEPHQPISADGE
ncbi:MAG: polyphosphate kinase 1 [Planctomycetota bacterium]|nr:MAG: polyphosphate kinase 1 [Planctomycetota bacterium]